MANSVTQAGFLRFHIPIAITVLLLTLFRIVWWWRFDHKPTPIKVSRPWQERFVRFVHIAFYVVIFGMVASGIGMIVLSDAASIIFGGTSTLPDFHGYPPRVPHGIGTFLLVILLLAHIGAALYHHFIRRDGLTRRMW